MNDININDYSELIKIENVLLNKKEKLIVSFFYILNIFTIKKNKKELIIKIKKEFFSLFFFFLPESFNFYLFGICNILINIFYNILHYIAIYTILNLLLLLF